MAEILVGVAILFDSSNRLARAQTHVAELQQSLRVGQSEIVRYANSATVWERNNALLLIMLAPEMHLA